MLLLYIILLSWKLQYEAKHNISTKTAVGKKVLVQTMKNVERKGGRLEPQFTGGHFIVAEDLGKVATALNIDVMGSL